MKSVRVWLTTSSGNAIVYENAEFATDEHGNLVVRRRNNDGDLFGSIIAKYHEWAFAELFEKTDIPL